MKVRGFRVELGEVESSIARHPCVDRAVVVAHAAPTRGSYLIGYVTPAKDRVLVVTELNSFLRGRIPAYMIPSEFLALDALPLTRNGKINYDLLPAPSRASGNGRPPQSGEEKFLCEAFSELLGVSDVSVSDIFFDLGGNSLLAVSLINRVRAALHAEIGIRDVFDAPTIAQLAERLRDSRPDRPVLHARSQQSGQSDDLHESRERRRSCSSGLPARRELQLRGREGILQARCAGPSPLWSARRCERRLQALCRPRAVRRVRR